MDNDYKTAIDMALDSGYKQLASRLARSNLIAARTEVSRELCITLLVLLYVCHHAADTIA